MSSAARRTILDPRILRSRLASTIRKPDVRRVHLWNHTAQVSSRLDDNLRPTRSSPNEVMISIAGRSSRFHSLWLRDHCRCPECFHSVTKQRLFDTFKLDSSPLHVAAGEEGMSVTWRDHHNNGSTHISMYPWEFLDPPHPRRAGAGGTEGRLSPLGKQYWLSSEISKKPPTVQYEAVMRDDAAVLSWLEKVDMYGLCFVEGVPSTPEDTENLIKRIAFIRITQYGGFWDFTADLARGDTAYTSLALGAHTDTTYFRDPCGLQIFHMLSHTEGSGGASLLVDGFAAASRLREENRDHFDTLVSTPIPAHAVGDLDYHFVIPELRGNPIITVDRSGDPVRIAYNNDDRGTIRGKTVAELDEWYEALRHWNQVLTSPETEYWVQLQPGVVLVIDNHRVLHGRSAFTGKRRMCGAYIGADDYQARMRALRNREQDQRWIL